MNLIQEYLLLANEVISFRETVYDGVSAEKHNQKVNRMIAIASEIQQNQPELKHGFSELLSHENPEIRIWAAHHILEYMDYEKAIRKNALKEIRYRSRRDKTAYGLGEKLWLKDWYKHHPKDRWI